MLGRFIASLIALFGNKGMIDSGLIIVMLSEPGYAKQINLKKMKQKQGKAKKS